MTGGAATGVGELTTEGPPEGTDGRAVTVTVLAGLDLAGVADGCGPQAATNRAAESTPQAARAACLILDDAFTLTTTLVEMPRLDSSAGIPGWNYL